MFASFLTIAVGATICILVLAGCHLWTTRIPNKYLTDKQNDERRKRGTTNTIAIILIALVFLVTLIGFAVLTKDTMNTI